jgi:valyl-tRNA synthetase
MIAPYPKANEAAFDTAAEAEIEDIMEIIRAMRNVRAEYKVESARWIEAKVYTSANTSRYAEAIKTLGRANPITYLAGEPKEKADAKTIVLPLAHATVVIPMASMFDLEAEKKKLQKDLDQTQAEADRLNARLTNAEFLAKAPPAVVEKEKQRLYTLSEKLDKLRIQISGL